LDEYSFLSRKEFEDLKEEDKWTYLQSIINILKQYKINADKNCEECEKYNITPVDLNIDLLFEDWRECKNLCEDTGKCGKEEQIIMCDLQFQLMNHIAEEVNSLRQRINGLIKTVIRKDEKARKIAEGVAKKLQESEKGAANLYG